MQMKTHISKEEMDAHWNAPYKVRAIVPAANDPYLKEFNVYQEELNEYLRDYNDRDEFLISMEVSKKKKETTAKNVGKKIKFTRTDFKEGEPFSYLLKQLGINQEKMNDVEEIALVIFDGIYSYPFSKTIVKE